MLIKTQSVALLLVCLCAALPVPRGGAAQTAVTDYDRTCQYYTNMAFQDRRAGTVTTFRMQLAQDCVDAMIYAGSDEGKVRERALTYLARMEAYRQTIIGMLMARARARDYSNEEMTMVMRPAVDPVSRAGAYLIARDMGLVSDHEEWTAWRMQAVVPHFRLDEAARN